ncbi:MAG: shikimate kinase [Acidimicrobiia bacterium]
MSTGPLVWLVGMMGSGKSRVGRVLATRTEADFIDTDAEITRLAGLSITEIFEVAGEDRFRDLEEKVVAAVVAPWRVISTGGGVVLRNSNIDVMRSAGTVVWLRAEPSTLAERVQDGHGRPLLGGDEPIDGKLIAIYEQRRPLYERAAHHVIDTDGLSAESVAEIVEELWLGS